jgi:glycosyltransferase involved in cell wall biosynthesis
MQVSVIIPVFNAAAFVSRAVESALAQEEVGQVLLVEDGSSDGSLAICRAMASRCERVEVLQHPGGQNRGVGASRNLGIAAARCACVAFLDADDYYLPGRFLTAAAILDQCPDVDGVYDAIGTDYGDTNVSGWYRRAGHPELITLSRRVDPSRLFEELVAGDGGYFHGNGLVVRAELFCRTGGFDPSLRMGEDTAMWIRMSALGRLVAGSLDRPVGMRRLHANNTIYHGRQDAPAYVVRMAESLLRWGYEERLSRRRRVLLLNWLFNFELEDDPTGKPYARRKMRELRFFVTFALRHPLALWSRHFWSVVAVTCGWNRVRALLGTHDAPAAPANPGEVA